MIVDLSRLVEENGLDEHGAIPALARSRSGRLGCGNEAASGCVRQTSIELSMGCGASGCDWLNQ